MTDQAGRPAARFAPPWDDFAAAARGAVAEDMPGGDPTGALVGDRPARGRLVSRQPGTVAGLVAARVVLDEVARVLGARLGTGAGPGTAAAAAAGGGGGLGGAATAQLSAVDGDRVEAGAVLGTLEGPAAVLLAGERTVLNIATHLSGIATATAAAVAAVAGIGTVVRDTRKTHAGLRALEKYAVRCGGGVNHRMSLSDAILVKDNHVAVLGGVGAAVRAAHISAARAGLGVEVEVDTLDELDEALAAGARMVLLDNMSLADMSEAVRRASAYGAELEASGGLSLANLAAVAGTGVHYVAIGALTHSAPALDIGLDWSIG